jgi:heavy metal translocating P-type ATPase
MNGRLFNWVLLSSSTVLLAAGNFFEGAWLIAGLLGLIPAITWLIQDLRNHTMGSDVLAVISIISALAIAEFAAAAIVSVMLATGRVLEKWAEGRAERELKLLLSRIPKEAHLRNQSGEIEEIALDQVHVGDSLLIRTGEITPTDARLEGFASLDESALTGEPLPVAHAPGEEISSGVINAGAPFFATATTTSATSTYMSIIKLVKEAQNKSAPGVRIANMWAIRFVPVALVMAGLSWALTGDVHRAVAVLVIATPCPLILAVPIAIVSGLSRAAKNGAIIKNGAILEKLSQAEIILLDKTGTLTHGGPSVEVIETGGKYSSEEILTFAASIDQYSPHIVAKSLVHAAIKSDLTLRSATEITEASGHHISGLIDGSRVQVGQFDGDKPAWVTLETPLLVWVVINEIVEGVIGLSDPVRSESRNIIENLRAEGIKDISLVTGDRTESAEEVAKTVGITQVFANVTPEGKLDITRAAMARAKGSVVVVGDGINDAPALAAADVGIAMGAHGASAASEAADVVIVEDSLSHLVDAISIARTSRRKASQAATLGMSLAFIGMFFAAFGFLTPSQGAILQEGIDILAILWALSALRG